MPLASHWYKTPSGQLGYTNPRLILYNEVERYRAAGYDILYDPADDRDPDVLLVEEPRARCPRPTHRDE